MSRMIAATLMPTTSDSRGRLISCVATTAPPGFYGEPLAVRLVGQLQELVHALIIYIRGWFVVPERGVGDLSVAGDRVRHLEGRDYARHLRQVLCLLGYALDAVPDLRARGAILRLEDEHRGVPGLARKTLRQQVRGLLRLGPRDGECVDELAANEE